MSKQNHIVVVGGGIAGILSALLSSRDGHKVTLIEKAGDIGGLLRSFNAQDDVFFDSGTHVLRGTGIEELDQILFGDITQDNYNIFEYPKTGNFYRQLNEHSPFIDLNSIDMEDHLQGVKELLSITEIKDDVHSLEEKLLATFGKCITEKVFAPVMRKLLKSELADLVPEAHLFFGLSRVLALTPDESRELKKTPIVDDRLGFHSFKEGVSSNKSFYPHRGGVGAWIERLKTELKKADTEVLLNNSVTEIRSEAGQIQQVILEDTRQLDCDFLIWTIPSFMLIKAAQINPDKKLSPPKRLMSCLYHFVIDKPYKTDLHYAHCYDERLKTFRVTFYRNLNDQVKEGYPLTVEVLTEEVTDLGEQEEIIFNELKEMNMIDGDSKIVLSKTDLIKEGFPIPTHQFKKDSTYQNELVSKHFDNLRLLGKASGKAFFMIEVLRETFDCMNKLYEAAEIHSY